MTTDPMSEKTFRIYGHDWFFIQCPYLAAESRERCLRESIDSAYEFTELFRNCTRGMNIRFFVGRNVVYIRGELMLPASGRYPQQCVGVYKSMSLAVWRDIHWVYGVQKTIEWDWRSDGF